MRIIAEFAGFVSLALANCAISRVQIPHKDQILSCLLPPVLKHFYKLIYLGKL